MYVFCFFLTCNFYHKRDVLELCLNHFTISVCWTGSTGDQALIVIRRKMVNVELILIALWMPSNPSYLSHFFTFYAYSTIHMSFLSFPSVLLLIRQCISFWRVAYCQRRRLPVSSESDVNLSAIPILPIKNLCYNLLQYKNAFYPSRFC